MSNTVEKESSYNDGTYVVKKSRKHSILAFIICLFVAFAIWLYATNKENERLLGDKSEDSTQTTDVVSSDT